MPESFTLSSFTIMVWYHNHVITTTLQSLLKIAGSDSIEFRILSQHLEFRTQGQGQVIFTQFQMTPVPENQWVHLTVSYDSNESKS